jgi:hypothetical protein
MYCAQFAIGIHRRLFSSSFGICHNSIGNLEDTEMLESREDFAKFGAT